MFDVLKKYAPKIAPQAFAQMGFMDAKFATNALLSIKGPITAKSYNLAVRSLKNQKTDILCKPFYVGNALPYHIPNNTFITVDYKDGKVVVKTGCFADPGSRHRDRPDASLGEEVQAQHREVRSKGGNDDQGARGCKRRRRPGGASVTDLLALSVFGVDWTLIKPFIVIGLAFGGVYALSGVGLVVLYRATGVLNVAFGAIGAAGALIAYYLVSHTGWPHWLAYTVCVAFGGVVNLAYGLVFGPAFARRDPLVKMMGTLGLALSCSD